MKRRVLIRRILSILILTVSVTALAAIGLNVQVFSGFQRRATDFLFPAAPDDPNIAVVGFDGKAISALGYPVPRATVADLTTKLAAAGAKVIAYDVIYRTDQPGDDQFKQAIADAGNVILATQVDLEPAKGDAPPVARSATGFASDIGQPGRDFAFAHAQANADPSDGVNRSVPLVVDAGGEFVPALALEAVARFRGFDGPVTVRPNGVQIGDRFVPAGEAKAMTLNFSPKLSDTSNVISAADVISGDFDKKDVAGKIVFVGAIDSTLGDNKTAPVNKSSGIPGVLLHANAANTILTGTYLEPVSDTQTLLWVAVITAIIGAAVLLLPLWASIIVTLLVGASYIVFAFTRFNTGQVMNFVYPSMAVLFSFIGGLGLRYFGETRQRRRVTALFSQYVPEAVAQRLVDEDRAGSAVEGERLDMTVLFCDLRGFTALSENLEPAVVRIMLNHYYDRVTDIVLAMDGTLMKYVGDEVFAVWGAPLPTEDHPQRALDCAIAIQQLTPQLNVELLEQGAPEVSFGIGLNSGEAVAAHFGGGRRRQYDVVGDTVNVGARLCSAAPRGEIVLSDAVLTRVTCPLPVEPLGPVELKGVSRELRLWRVAPLESTNVSLSVTAAEQVVTVPET